MAAQQDQNTGDKNNIYSKMWKIFDQRSAAEDAAHLLPHLKPHYRVLDLGCGRGSISIDLARLVPNGSVLGVDVNPTLIEGATSQAVERKVNNIEFQVMDANDLSSLPSGSFDVIHENQVLLHLQHKIPILRELYRILKPGGILSMRDIAILGWYPLDKFPHMRKHIHYSLSHTRDNQAGLPFGLWSHEAAREAGFGKPSENTRSNSSSAKIEVSSWGWTWRDPPSWIDTAKGSVSSLLLARGDMTEVELEQAEKEMEEWAWLPQARLQGLDGAVLCWKED